MSENNTEFKSKLCLVTGAGQGIGLACAKSLLEQGATVIACLRYHASSARGIQTIFAKKTASSNVATSL
ncbi:SDR family oxidoreductase [Vibrio harveyi]|nr:SDR family oxidoreductase [Vibrio harveyi]